MGPIIRAITDTLMDEVTGDPGQRIQAVGQDLDAFLKPRMDGLVDAAKAEGLAALAAAAAEVGATQTASGLVFQSIKEGKGPKPTDSSAVEVHAVEEDRRGSRAREKLRISRAASDGVSDGCWTGCRSGRWTRRARAWGSGRRGWGGGEPTAPRRIDLWGWCGFPARARRRALRPRPP